MITLDDILDDVGIGCYHYKTVFGMGLLIFILGTNAMVLSLTLYILTNE